MAIAINTLSNANQKEGTTMFDAISSMYITLTKLGIFKKRVNHLTQRINLENGKIKIFKKHIGLLF